MNNKTPTTSKESTNIKSARLRYLDWLRVIATLGDFLYHAVRPFDLQDWLIKNEERSGLVTLIYRQKFPRTICRLDRISLQRLSLV